MDCSSRTILSKSDKQIFSNFQKEISITCAILKCLNVPHARTYILFQNVKSGESAFFEELIF